MDDLKRARLLAVEVLLADPDALHNDALEADLYPARPATGPDGQAATDPVADWLICAHAMRHRLRRQCGDINLARHHRHAGLRRRDGPRLPGRRARRLGAPSAVYP